MQILIVEDDERVAAALEAFLARSGYASVRAADGASALQLLGADTEVVLLDLGPVSYTHLTLPTTPYV